MLFQVLPKLDPLHFASLGEGRVSLRLRDLGKLLQHGTKKEAQPDTFAGAFDPHQIHAVVPVAGAHERQAVYTELKAMHDSAHTVLVNAGRFRRAARQIVVGVVPGVHRATFQELDRFIEHAAVAGRLHIACGHERQPEKVIRTARAHAAARRRMPPMLDIAVHELTARTAKQVLAHECGVRVDERHHVLQLVAEAEGSPRLVVAAARPEAAGHRLVQQPTVGEHVKRRIGRLNLHGAERALPVRFHRVQRAMGGGRSPKALHQAARVSNIPTRAKAEGDFALLAIGKLERDLEGGAGIERRAHLAG